MKTILSFFLFSMVFLGISGHSHAQSMQVFGASSYAENCYQDSSMANRLGNAAFADLDNCNKAIEYGKLRKRDLLATYINRGILYANMGNLNRAAKDYRKALELNEDVPEAYLNRGNLWFIAERYQEAVADYGKALELELEQLHIVYLNRGMAYESMGLYDEARQDYMASLDIIPDWEMAIEKLQRVEQKQSELNTSS